MNQAQIIWAALIGAALIVNLPLIGFIRYLFIAGKIEMVVPEFQKILDQLNALVGPVTTLKATADGAAGSVSAQDVTDTVAALQTAVNGVAVAAGQPTQ